MRFNFKAVTLSGGAVPRRQARDQSESEVDASAAVSMECHCYITSNVEPSPVMNLSGEEALNFDSNLNNGSHPVHQDLHAAVSARHRAARE